MNRDERNDLLGDLRAFGPPLFVPAEGPWRVAAVEQTDGVPDAVLVFGRGGDVSVKTEAAARPRQPLSIRVASLQRAGSDPRRPELDLTRVIVDELEREVWVAGARRRVRVLESRDVFGLVIEVGGRVVSAGGLLPALATLRLEQLDGVDALTAEG